MVSKATAERDSPNFMLSIRLTFEKKRAQLEEEPGSAVGCKRGRWPSPVQPKMHPFKEGCDLSRRRLRYSGSVNYGTGIEVAIESLTYTFAKGTRR